MQDKIQRSYIAIDLKSFYASVECVERGLDPLTTNLVVADESRTEKTICLAVSPSLKSYGISGRARLFEVLQKVKQVNAARKAVAPGRKFRGASSFNPDVQSDPSLALDYIVAKPQMARYMEVSSTVFGIYLKYISAEDIHVYSVDEAFLDVTDYLKVYKCSAHELAMRMIRDVLGTTGITATAGIGTNLYLAKVAMDIVAKHKEADEDGVRIAQLDEMSFRQELWAHRPLTDFWRTGKGIAARLENAGIFTMGDLARCSLSPAWEEHLYKLFGVAAELIIDHAWGWEPCTIADIKAYKPESKSLSSGQVLSCPYDFEKARVVILEMADNLALELVEKGLLTDQIVVNVYYDSENLTEPHLRSQYSGPVVMSYYGKPVPKPVHGSQNLPYASSGTALICDTVGSIFDRIVDRRLLVRRLNVAVMHLVNERTLGGRQMNLFDSSEDDPRERARQQAILAIRQKFGKNAILKGMNFEEGATAIERNSQIGGHKA